MTFFQDILFQANGEICKTHSHTKTIDVWLQKHLSDMSEVVHSAVNSVLFAHFADSHAFRSE